MIFENLGRKRMEESIKEKNSLAGLINQVDSQNDFSDWGLVAKQNMKDNYTWEKIVGEYEELFLS